MVFLSFFRSLYTLGKYMHTFTYTSVPVIPEIISRTKYISSRNIPNFHFFLLYLYLSRFAKVRHSACGVISVMLTSNLSSTFLSFPGTTFIFHIYHCITAAFSMSILSGVFSPFLFLVVFTFRANSFSILVE